MQSSILAAGILLTIIGATALQLSPAYADEPTEIVTVHPDDAGAAAMDVPSMQKADASEPASVVGRAALDRYVAPTGNYADAVRLTPSVMDVSPNGPGLGEAQILTIRGFTDGQYNVTYDGIPFADSDDFTHHSSAYLTMRDLSSVTVDRGPGDAATIGDATFGGTVAFRSLGTSGPGTIAPGGSLGSFATRTGGLLLKSGAGTLPGGASGAFDVEAVQSKGALDGAAQRRATVFGKLVVPLAPSVTLTLVGNAGRTVQNEPPGATREQIAVSGPATALNDDPRSQAYAGYSGSAYRTDMSYAALDVALPDGSTLTDTLYSYGLDRHLGHGLDPNGETPNGTALGIDHVPGQMGRIGLRAWGDVLHATRRLSTGLSLDAGAWIERQTNARSLVEVDETEGGALNPVLDVVPGVPGSGAIDRMQRETLLTLQPYAQLDWQARRWLDLTAGLKGAWFDRDISADIMQGTRQPTRVDRAFGAVLPSVTARARLGQELSLYAQVARGFLAPQLQLFDVTNPRTAAISPEDTWNFQVGAMWSGPGLAVAADLYEIVFGNAVGVRTVGGESEDFAEGRIVYRGIEAEGSRQLGFGLSLYGSGSLNQAHQSASAGGVSGPAPTTPQATLAAGLTYARNGVSASIVDRWVGGSYGDVGRAQWIDPTNQLDISAATTLARRGAAPIEIKAQVFNLLDSRRINGLAGYTVAANSPLFWTQPGRSIFVGAGVKF